MPPAMGPDELVTAAMIARQYYIDRMTKQRIADLHGVSRHKVARILRKARESGLVRIEVGGTTQADIELGETLHHLNDERDRGIQAQTQPRLLECAPICVPQDPSRSPADMPAAGQRRES